mmetsp:Transcript_61569/g.200933  ORF Transcript_61569/g.200933 Transcript_61569/m.200933 type:complete len:200 (-) Transcript_61569:448-1047(-)
MDRPGARLDPARVAGCRDKPLQWRALGPTRAIRFQARAAAQAGGLENLRGARGHELDVPEGGNVLGLCRERLAAHQAPWLQRRAAYGRGRARALRQFRLPRDVLLRAQLALRHARGVEGARGSSSWLGLARAHGRRPRPPLLELVGRHRHDGRHGLLLHPRRPEGPPVAVGLEALPLHQARGASVLALELALVARGVQV